VPRHGERDAHRTRRSQLLDHQLTNQVARLDTGQVTTWTSWHRWTAISLLAYAFLAGPAALQRARDGNPGELGLIPVTIPELLRHLRGTVIPEPRRDKARRDAWSLWRRRHQYQAQQAHQRWHTYADETPQYDLQLLYTCASFFQNGRYAANAGLY